jgi:arabinose-5-phosphate isomerase
MGLAPTTSTTAMLAIGDALAVALLERKNFTPAHFRLFHPGGRLGQRLIRVSEIMHDGSALPLVGLDAAMGEALIEMTAKSFGCVGVLDGTGNLAGIVTDGDLRRHMNAGLLRQKVREIMTTGPKSIEPDALAAEAVRKMNDSRITSLFVVDANKPVGIVHIHDCLRAGVA